VLRETLIKCGADTLVRAKGSVHKPAGGKGVLVQSSLGDERRQPESGNAMTFVIAAAAKRFAAIGGET